MAERLAPAGHEGTEIRIRPVILFVAGFVTLGLLTHLALGWLFQTMKAQQIQARGRPQVIDMRQTPLSPRLQANPVLDMERLRAREARLLNSYDWVDRQAGVVRIPIDRAMDLLVARGVSSQPIPQATRSGR